MIQAIKQVIAILIFILHLSYLYYNEQRIK